MYRLAGFACSSAQVQHFHMYLYRVLDIYCYAFQFHFRGKAHTLGIPTQLRCFYYPAAAILLLLLLSYSCYYDCSTLFLAALCCFP